MAENRSNTTSPETAAAKAARDLTRLRYAMSTAMLGEKGTPKGRETNERTR